MTRTVLAICAVLTATACGGGGELRDPSGKYRLIEQVHAPKLRATLQRQDDVALVVAFDTDARDTATVARQARERGRPLVVAIGHATASAEQDAADALVLTATGADAAIDLALLAANGIGVPQTRIPIGTRIITPADEAAGGEPFAAPGDFVLQMLRHQHGEALRPGPVRSFPMLAVMPPVLGSANSGLRERISRLSDDLQKAAARYPQIDLLIITSNSQDDAIAQELAQRPCKGVIALVDDPDNATRIREQCGTVPAILVDPEVRDLGTTTVGCRPEILGRALADAVRRLLPDGGDLLTVAVDKRSPRTLAIRQGFLDELELQTP